jgi:nucleolar GTP-binding protein
MVHTPVPTLPPLFSNKPTLLVINKIYIMWLDDLPSETRALVQEIIHQDDVQCVQISCYSEEGVMDVKNKACDAKLQGSKINSVINRIHVAQPKARDDVVREPFIPDAVKEKKYDENDSERRPLLRDIELEPERAHDGADESRTRPQPHPGACRNAGEAAGA